MLALLMYYCLVVSVVRSNDIANFFKAGYRRNAAIGIKGVLYSDTKWTSQVFKGVRHHIFGSSLFDAGRMTVRRGC